jgi:hypothetical protein
MGVQVARRLVGKNDLGVVDQCASDGNALLLSSGKLHGAVFAPVFEVHEFEGSHGAVPTFATGSATVDHGSSTFYATVSLGSRLKNWKTNPIFSLRMRASCFWTHFESRCRPAKPPPRRRIKAAEDVHQRGLAAAARTDDGDELASVDVQRKVVQSTNLFPAQMINLADVAKLDERHFGSVKSF